MRVPIMWLRDYVDLPANPDEIVARLATLGFPVDEIDAREELTSVVAGRIAKLEKHPNADRLSLCTMDVGDGTPLLIATAATNVAQGQLVPVARIGAQLAGGLKIAPRKMRGIDSQGMLCSANELGLPEDWFEDGIMQLDESVPLGTDVVALYRLTDPVLEVDVTPNRPDALSIVGLARELAAAFGVPLREPATAVQTKGASDDTRVTIETVDCKRFVYQRASGVQVRPGATWMRLRLALAGQRPIDNVVDISNFVMLELGQPLHFFDHARIAGAHLIVRDAGDGERFTTLDGQERTLDSRMIVIADEQGPTSLAGVMGGQRSEVQPDTTEVLIEAATWTGPRIRRTSTALKLRSEASSRFEKSLPPALTDLGAARAAHLLEAEGGIVRAPQAAGAPAAPPAPVALRTAEVRRLLGFTVDAPEIERALGSLGFRLTRDPDGFAVVPPYWRNDVLIPADLVEEIARVVGYDHVRAEVPPVAPQAIDSAEFERENELAATLAALGYTEFLTLSLQPGSVARTWREAGLTIPAPVEITNPLSEDQRWMRFALAPALLEFAARDRAVRPYRVFELGHVFADAQGQPEERVELTALHAGGGEAFGRLKADVLALLRRVTGVDARVERGAYASLHPGKTAALRVGETLVGYVGVVDPRLARAYDVPEDTALATLFVAALPAKTVRRYAEPSKFPPVDRDLAVVVPLDVLAGELTAAVRGEELVRTAAVFDEYRGPQVGEGKKSLALRIVLQSDETTLTDEAAEAALSRIVAALRERFGATPRT
ncbi:MAG: phenylalanyl-tRNA synthetase beta chain [Candidatus Eremiobacteraeota bacterium]|jgi:phenylalanyl-tRNA synthetase beta chain|nr:phenylalanyl-tRNA synthetase beta chain [Candidatus Eremiobacteraeota bacterium]